MIKTAMLASIALIFMMLSPSPGSAQAVTIKMTPSVPSPQMLGTAITWTATVQNPVAGHTYDYQFSTWYNGNYQICLLYTSDAADE